MSRLAGIIQKIIEEDGHRDDMPWLYKDAKLTILWPIYKKAFPDATWIIVKRDEDGFINLCLHTHFMKQHSENRDFWKKFAHEYQIRIEALKDSGARTLEISSPNIIGGNLESLKELVTKIGLDYREKELKEFICPAYWHGDSNKAKLIGGRLHTFPINYNLAFQHLPFFIFEFITEPEGLFPKLAKQPNLSIKGLIIL